MAGVDAEECRQALIEETNFALAAMVQVRNFAYGIVKKSNSPKAAGKGLLAAALKQFETSIDELRECFVGLEAVHDDLYAHLRKYGQPVQLGNEQREDAWMLLRVLCGDTLASIDDILEQKAGVSDAARMRPKGDHRQGLLRVAQRLICDFERVSDGDSLRFKAAITSQINRIPDSALSSPRPSECVLDYGRRVVRVGTAEMRLTKVQTEILLVLQKAGKGGLKGSALEKHSGHGDARKTLRLILSKSEAELPGLKAFLTMARVSYGGYHFLADLVP